MLRKILIIGFIAALVVFCLNGCKKQPDKEPLETDEIKAAADNEVEAKEQIKTAAEYGAEAKEQITEENMGEELDRIEKELEEELGLKP